jgi:hypothetical protein
MVEQGKVLKIIKESDWCTQIVIRKKWNNSYIVICFSAFDESKRIINQINVEKGDTIKINYHIFSKEYKNKYYTTAVIDFVKITEKKSAQLMVDMETGEIL